TMPVVQFAQDTTEIGVIHRNIPKFLDFWDHPTSVRLDVCKSPADLPLSRRVAPSWVSSLRDLLTRARPLPRWPADRGAASNGHSRAGCPPCALRTFVIEVLATSAAHPPRLALNRLSAAPSTWP